VGKNMKKIKVKLSDRGYSILIGRGILSSAGDIIKSLKIASTCFVLTNKKIKALYGERLKKSLINAGLDSVFYTVVDSEKAKSHTSWFNAIRALAMFDKGKGVCLLALGGGVIGDLGGFIASTYRRGIAFVQIPTTLLAQVDSAIGGKTAIDMDCAKNLIGTFYQPKAVLTDPGVLNTLPNRQVRNGLAEVIKYAVIMDKRFFFYIEKNIDKILKLNHVYLEHIISRCSSLKSQVVSADEHEKKGYRSILNFGHTIGHALESASSYKSSLNHGEAISVGMMCAFDIAVALGITDKASADRLECLLKATGLPVRTAGIKPFKVIATTLHDKKIINGKKRWVIPESIGHSVVCSNIPEGLIKRAVVNRITGKRF
jgi:3-dehydroquinate synthase